jgi:hypothetical protein
VVDPRRRSRAALAALGLIPHRAKDEPGLKLVNAKAADHSHVSPNKKLLS